MLDFSQTVNGVLTLNTVDRYITNMSNPTRGDMVNAPVPKLGVCNSEVVFSFCLSYLYLVYSFVVNLDNVFSSLNCFALVGVLQLAIGYGLCWLL